MNVKLNGFGLLFIGLCLFITWASGKIWDILSWIIVIVVVYKCWLKPLAQAHRVKQDSTSPDLKGKPNLPDSLAKKLAKRKQ